MFPTLDATFEPAESGGFRLYLHHRPAAQTPLRGAVLYLHPWAEEMNKSRRMAAAASRLMAARGIAVLQIDLLGCGDSSGDFGDASWQAWIDDALEALAWLRSRHPRADLWIWGLRAGALLATDVLRRSAEPANLLLWHPAPNGKAVLQQFLRLKAAAQLADGGGKAILAEARAKLSEGRHVEVAGYTLGADLAQGLESATLAPPEGASECGGASRRVVLLETSTQDDPRVSPAGLAFAATWQAAGWHVTVDAVPGPAFWQTTEIEDAPALLSATLAALTSSTAPHATDAANGTTPT